jgi:hypothetical protein
VRKNSLHDLGDDVASLLDQDPIALAKILPRDVLGIVQRRHRDGRTRQDDGLENRVRRDRAGAADVHGDFPEDGCRLFRGKLERRGPPGKLRRRPELRAQRQVVYLDHDAVGIERQRAPLLCPPSQKAMTSSMFRSESSAVRPADPHWRRRGEHVAVRLEAVPSARRRR